MMSKSKGYVGPEYLQAAAKRLKHIKKLSYDRMQIEPGHKVMDVGCGPGTDTITLGRAVGPGGQVVGIDSDEGMIAQAEIRAKEENIEEWVTHQRADVASLPFESDYFDSCRSERLFQHLPNYEQAFSEMIRVTKPFGWMVVLDTDWGTLSVDTTDVDIERRLVRFFAEYYMHNGYSGRQLYRQFKQWNLKEISVEMFPNYILSYAIAQESGIIEKAAQEALAAGVLTDDELRRFHEGLEEADARGLFFATYSMIMVAGRKS
jgi:ubiquinone/menaquinone biosynthesis C-methylase UbiE